MIRALIFDFDGLILDTETPEYASWQEVYQAQGHDLPIWLWAQDVGCGHDADKFAPYVHLEGLLGGAMDRDGVRAARRDRYAALVQAEVVRPGVADYLREARARGLKIGCASSSDCAWVSGHLRRLGLWAFFDALRCADDVVRIKPDPELYNAVLDALGVGAGEAVALEDSPNGVRAARAAGVFCVVVPNPLTRRLPLGHADKRVDSLADLPLGQLLEAVAATPRG